MDMKIAGSGMVGPGEYDHVKISGAGKLEGPIRCKSMHCAGSAHCYGEVEAHEDIRVSGSVHIEGDARAGSLHISGSAAIDGACTVKEELKIAGGFRCGGNVKANRLSLAGGIHAASIEAEEVHIEGTVNCPGLMNAEKIEIRLNGSGSELGSIGGSVIEIGKKKHGKSIGHLFFKKQGKGRDCLRVQDLIEGDELVLDHVQAGTVIGRIVKIGAGCDIKQVQYSESIEVDPNAEVGEQIKIS